MEKVKEYILIFFGGEKEGILYWRKRIPPPAKPISSIKVKIPCGVDSKERGV